MEFGTLALTVGLACGWFYIVSLFFMRDYMKVSVYCNTAGLPVYNRFMDYDDYVKVFVNSRILCGSGTVLTFYAEDGTIVSQLQSNGPQPFSTKDGQHGWYRV